MTGVEAAAISAVVSGIFKIVGNKLAPPLIKKYSSIVGVEKDLRELQFLVEDINSWLEKAGDHAMRGDASFNWLKRLEDVAYAVDDVVDEFQLKAERHDACGDGGNIVSKYLREKPKSFIFQCKAAKKIKAIKKRLDAIGKQRTYFNAIANGVPVCHSAQQISKTNEDRTTWPNVDVEKVLGRDKEKHQIISKLIETSDQQRIKIVSVIGLGGSGKTTLAKLVFNDGDIIEKHYEVRLWVHVSQEFDVSNLMKKLFEAIPNKDSKQYGLRDMINKVQEELTGKRFLVVLDDVWTECRIRCEEFMVFLKIGTPGSGILLTTRSRRVAETVGSSDQFDLPFLSPKDSWQLFQQSLIMPVKGWDFEFEELGKEIVKKCGGVPLAIKVLAGALRGRERIEEWEAIRDNNLLGVEGEEHGVSVSACLRLSYFHLPSHLKQCFTICSLFPKGHKIDKEQLIDLWIAHDMITLDPGVDYLDYIGHKYFNSLVQMSFLQVENEYDGRVIFNMHDLVHDLAWSILDDKISLDVPKDPTSCTKSYRYFSLTEQAQNLPSKNLFQKARSIYVDNCGDAIFGALKNARHLRSITIRTIGMKTIPISILQVKYLKYLVISKLQSQALPEAISDIWSLQALHVTFSNLLELPKSIGKLQKLRKLNLFHCWQLKCLPDSIGDCQMISSIDLSYCEHLTVLPESIGRIEELRVVRLANTKIERLPLGITALRNLEHLYLKECRNLEELPKGISNLEKLQVLDLKGCVNLRGMPVGIGQLSRLPKLDLFVVGEGEKFAAISELANVGRNSEDLLIRDIEHVMEPDDAYKACLKLNANLQRLKLQWRRCVGGEENTKLEQRVLDGLEPPPGIKELEITRYSGRECARWMQNQVGGGVRGFPCLPFLRVMKLYDFPNLKHLDGLVELPCLEELMLQRMPSLEGISGGPFPSLEWLSMHKLPSLGVVWMVAEKSMPDGCSNCTPHLGQVLQVGNCVSSMYISDCPKLEVRPYLPLSLQRLHLARSQGQVLQSPCGCNGSASSFSGFSHLKELELCGITGCGDGWELLQHMTALESLRIVNNNELTRLPECFRSLKSLQSLEVSGCSAMSMLPELEVHSLQELTISRCFLLRSLPQSMGHLTSLRSLKMNECSAISMLPESLGELESLQELTIKSCDSLTSLPQSMGHLISLRSLTMDSCRYISLLSDSLGELRSLHKLIIRRCKTLSSLPQSVGHLTSLQVLHISDCDALHELPEWLGELRFLHKFEIEGLRGLACLPESMCGLTSLEELSIWDCPGIKSLPEGIKGLTALRELWIVRSPDLVRRCERGTGEDWQLVSHIPQLEIR